MLNVASIDQPKMSEFDEFAEALLGQISVELNEEKEIMQLSEKSRTDMPNVRFEGIEQITGRVFPELRQKVEQFTGMNTPDDLRIEFPELAELKRIKANKVFSDDDSRKFVEKLFLAVAEENAKGIADMVNENAAKYLVYSTYAIQYISKISTTYGDYLDSIIYINKFILSRYPQIILHRQGPPYEAKFSEINSGYMGAIKMTVLEETVHSVQGKLHQDNKDAAMQVNVINEELAKIILSLDPKTVDGISEYLQLQAVPDDFPFAKKANLFFFLNPDHFLIEQIGPDVMTFTHVEIDPKIAEAIPQLADIYKRWLVPIQRHHAAFSTMEGMAAFVVENVLKDDADFQNYLTTFMGMDFSSYQVRKDMGKEFTKSIHERLGRESFRKLMEDPPNTRELKDPQMYLERINK